MKYVYSIVRFVPDAFRGEFVNVAIIAGSEATGEWIVRRVDNVQHARRIGGSVPITPVWSYLDGVENLIDQLGEDQLTEESLELNREWLRRESTRLRNLVQVTTPSAVLADSLEDAVNHMFEVFVVDPEKRTRKTRRAAVSALRSAFEATLSEPRDHLFERVSALVGRQQSTIDFAVANGSLAQLAHGWSFQTQDPASTVQQIKAWSWTMRDLREHGGVVRTPGDNREYAVSSDVPIRVVYVAPDTDEARRSLDEALEVFSNLEVTAVTTDEAYLVARDARDALETGHS
ncbi:hypothetical protein GCM10022223_48020 [Kineosporia mesophila]|uniref:DUF3037 domain-containing protein n=1 Tax=Kineosporia mesophila TaxID=566012 RepID=A0ABP7A5G8_9ACTN|nr:DUF3037 domain-containing protein [Kineosporia mesophila]MCD5351494.1 DUF3037 domain-containing protein [Kineosporia mesophila]